MKSVVGHVGLTCFMTLASGIMAKNILKTMSSYHEQRKEFLQKDTSKMIGINLRLDPDETIVNGIMKGLKDSEYMKATDKYFPGSQHFFHTKKYIESTKLFRIFKDMPKGAVLHAHDIALVSLDFVIDNLLHKPNLYIWRERASTGEETIKFRFLRTNQSVLLPGKWELVENVREEMGEQAFDDYVRKHLSLVVSDPEKVYPDEKIVWERFEYVLGVLLGVISYEDAFRIYNKQLLKEFYLDNVMYLEMRGFIPQLYTLDEELLPCELTIKIYKEISDDFVKSTNNQFMGMKYIATGFKSESQENLKSFLKLTLDLMSKYPDFLVGFDLVGQETAGKPIVEFADILVEAQEKHGMKYYMHAGETVQQGTPFDENLIDAILLNSSRIGHAFAAVRHPAVRNYIKERDIAIEVNPISNQVLNLIKDMRNHPAVEMIQDEFPMVISSDDFAVWGSSPLSHDMYFAYLVLSGQRGDLRTIKQLIMNSFVYSEMNQEEKRKAYKIWNKNWAKYMNQMARNFNDENSII